MESTIQNLVNALSLGGMYALLALGLTLIFTVLRLINFAQGELMTITGYILVFGLAAGWVTPVVVVAAIVAAGVGAIAMERLVFRPFRGADPTTLLLVSFALSVALQVAFQGLISARSKGVDLDLGLPEVIHLGGIDVDGLKLAATVVAFCSMAALVLFLRGTTFGLAMRAAAENFSVARLMGVRAHRVIAAAFLISGLLAGIAGVLWIAQRSTVDPLMGLTPLLKAFVAAIVGGLGSLVGVVAAAFLLAFLEVGFQSYLPEGLTEYRDTFVWLAVIMVLFLRPYGLFQRAPERI